tara:strand:- start:28 stop:276 length:249 start_codon:yes stop_codon:yes gene_type:complete
MKKYILEKEPTPKHFRAINLSPGQMGLILSENGWEQIKYYFLEKDKNRIVLGRTMNAINKKIKKQFPENYEVFCKSFIIDCI